MKTVSYTIRLDQESFERVEKEARIGTSGQPTDIEDLFSEDFYLERFNETFAKLLKRSIKTPELPPRDRIIDRIERFLKTQKIELRPSGGFNHYLVASTFAAKPPVTLDDLTLDRFAHLFKSVNSLM
jgi:hypothetical protein